MSATPVHSATPPARPGLLSFDEAMSRLLAHARPLEGEETLDTMDALERVLAADITSGLSVPPADNTSMDGYALRAADAGDAPMAVSQRIPAGHVGQPLQAGTVARIFTGAMIPAGADAVVMQEQVDVVSAPGTEPVMVRLQHRPKSGEWVRRRGEDIAEGAVILSAGHLLSAQSLGLAASVGVAQLRVKPRIKVACFFTGDELAMPGEPLKPGAIYNSNRFVLVNALRALGCEVTDLGIVPDTLQATREALRRAAQAADLILTSGGVSVGEEDHVRPAVQAEGELDLWQIAIKPGKPLAYGKVRKAEQGQMAHFIGLPGNPVSSLVTFWLFVKPFVRMLQGVAEPQAREHLKPLMLRADFDWPKPDKRREFLRVRINEQGGLDLYPNQSSGVLTSTVWADGLLDNPPQQAIVKGDLVRFLPMARLLK